MTVGTVNADLTLIPDQAEVWLALASDVTDIATMLPSTLDSDLAALGWDFTGYIDDKKGIPLNPSIEIKEYDAFGHPKFRIKLKRGKLESGFTALEKNATTKKIVLPGSADHKRGIPKNIQIYVLYKYIDEDASGSSGIWVTLTKAPVELKATSGWIDGELFWAEMVVHHTTDANNDVFEVIDEDGS